MKKRLMVKILLFIGLPAVLIYSASFLFITQNVKQSVSRLTESELTSQSQAASYEVNNYFSKYIDIAEQLKLNSALQNFLANASSYSKYEQGPGFQELDRTLRNITASDPDNIVDSWIADTATNHSLDQTVGVDNNYVLSTRPWYKKLTESKKTILTDPYEDVATKVWTVSAITPIYKSDGSTLIGVAAVDITLNHLYDMMKSYKLGTSGFYILASADGNMIYFPQEAMKNKNLTASQMSKNMIAAMQSQKTGFLSYTAMGGTNYGCVSKVGDTGWTVATGLPENEFYSAYDSTFATVLAIFLFASVLLVVLIVLISRGIVRPLGRLKNAANQIAEGNLSVAVSVISSDEIGQVGAAMTRTVDRLRTYIAYIDEITAVLDRIAAGDLTFQLSCDYTGDFARIKTSLGKIKSNLTGTFAEINMVAEQVAGGSGQVSNASQALAQGATEQASTIEQLSAAISEIAGQVKNNAEHAETAKELSRTFSEEFRHGSALVQQMTDAMSEIRASSDQISKIVKTIEDITFQTNILALNASVEAARAGEAGKGFAVVAEEVRSLANRSAQAAQSTTALIQGVIRSVQHGSETSDETSKSLQAVASSMDRTVELIDGISEESRRQALSIGQVNQGIEQVAAVVQTNSATSEEGAASSEELNEQAQSLKALIQRFRIG